MLVWKVLVAVFGKTSFARRYVPVKDVVFSRNFQGKKPQNLLCSSSFSQFTFWYNDGISTWKGAPLNSLTAGSPTNHPIEIRKSHLNQTSIFEFHLNLGGGFDSFVFSPRPSEIIQFDQYISNGLKASKESKKGAVKKKPETTLPKTNKSF